MAWSDDVTLESPAVPDAGELSLQKSYRMASLLFLGPWNESEVVDPKTLTLATFHSPPYVYVSSDVSRRPTGYLVDLMDSLSQELGLDVQFDTSTAAGDFGTQNADGGWSGLVGKLVNQTAHVGLAPFRWRQEFGRVVDYMDSAPVSTHEIYSFMVPGSYRSSMDSFTAILAPFHLYVWLCLVLSVVVSAMVLRLTNPETSGTNPEISSVNPETSSVNPETSSINKETSVTQGGIQGQIADTKDDLKLTWISSLLHVFGCIAQQGWSHTPQPLSSRMVTISVRCMALIIYVQYTASLISVMTRTEVAPLIESVEEFTARDDWFLLVDPRTSHIEAWKTSKEDALRILYQRIKDMDRVKELTPYNVHEMLEPNTVTFYEQHLPFFSLGAKACDLVTLNMQGPRRREEVTMGRRGYQQFLVVQQNLAIKQRMSTLLQTLYQSGAVDRLYNHWFLNTTIHNCRESSRTAFQPLGFTDLSAMVYIVSSGLLVSLVVVFLERFHHQLIYVTPRRKQMESKQD